MLSAARKVADYFRNTPTAARALQAQQLDDEQRRILVENQTRWDSEFVALSRLSEEKDAVLAATNVLEKDGSNPPSLSVEDWQSLEKVLSYLAKAHHVSKRLQSRDLYLSECAPMMMTLCSSLALDLTLASMEWEISFLTTFQTSIQKRLTAWVCWLVRLIHSSSI